MDFEIRSLRGWLFVPAASEITFALLALWNPEDIAKSGRCEGRLWVGNGHHRSVDFPSKARGLSRCRIGNSRKAGIDTRHLRAR